jgi:aminoglycoside phosphotransferase (APT) family kinase protein
MVTDACLTGADLRGWSALTLLGHATRDAGRWLFLCEPAAAWLSSDRLADAHFLPVPLRYDGTWPFADGALAGVVIDGDAVVRSVGEARLEHLLNEARRVTAAQDNVLVACTHRRVPRHLRAWREYGRHTLGTWRRAAARLGIAARTVGSLRLDGPRVTGLDLVSSDRHGSTVDNQADRVVLWLSTPRPDAIVIADELIAEVARAAGIGLAIDRIAVRKIGKTAIFASGSDGRRYIMRIARSPIALMRAQRNFETLATLRRSTLPRSITSLAPLAVVQRVHAGYAIFLETCLDGVAGPVKSGRRGPGGWARDAVEFITALHMATARKTTIDARWLAARVSEPVARIVTACGEPAAQDVLRRAEAACHTALAGLTLPLVQTHGDFTDSNCLFAPDGALTGVVDWELALADGLPLLDLLQLMPVAAADQPHRWPHLDAWLALLREPARVAAAPILGTYMNTLGVPAASVPALVLLQWITHVADRITARGDDQSWLRLRVWQPLESLGRLLRE